MTDRSIESVRVRRYPGAELNDDRVAVEEPLEIRLGWGPLAARRQQSVSITMRTPGHDDELALGFLFSEGIISCADQVRSVGPCGDSGAGENAVRVELAEAAPVDLDRLQRHFYTTSSCGVCGKQSLAALDVQAQFSLADTNFCVASSCLATLPDQLRDRQPTFRDTGSIHAAASFTRDGHLLDVFEDVGRHNALDKLIGHSLRSGLLPLSETGILVSGRASFELVQKATMAGCPLLAAVGGPSSLAVSAAGEFGMTLVAFLRGDRFNVYTGAERVAG